MPTKTIEEFPNRTQLQAMRSDLSADTQITVKDGFSCIQGDVLGKITVGGLYRRRPSTDAGAGGFSDAAATGVVDDASVFKAGDVLTTAAGTAIGTILSIALDTNTITLTANAANDVAAGVEVIASDGSQVADCIADAASDADGDTTIPVLITGLVVESKLRGLNDSAKTELGGRSTANGIFKF